MSLLLGVIAWTAIPFVLAGAEGGSGLLGFQRAVSTFAATMVLFWPGLVLVLAGAVALVALRPGDP